MIKTFLTGISLALRSTSSQRRSLLPPLCNFFCSSKDITVSPLATAA